METIIGIDLGTTNSEVAVVHEGKIKVLLVDGYTVMPSVVSVNAQQEMVVGRSAVNNELVAPDHTICRIKRKMGQDEFFLLGGKAYTPQMVSSLILKRLKCAAEAFLQHSVSKAVITVPAFFNEKQREATKEAAELCGLEVVRLLNEPTAAALAYALTKGADEYCLIYDLGGGTFDVSVVHISTQVMEVKASHGDVELGGADFDKMIAEQIRHTFLQQHKVDLAKDSLAWARIMRAAEAAKITLSSEAVAHVIEEFIITHCDMSLHVDFTITRLDFEEMIRPTIERTLSSVRKALEMAEISKDQLKRVILVGGVTYTPLVSQILGEELGLVPQAWQDPSLVVAMGAAVEAANLAGQAIGPIMVDITPHSLGTGCFDMDDYFCNHILIRRNTPLPCTVSKIFYKSCDNQRVVEVSVYQGEFSDVSKNTLLGEFRLEGLENSDKREVCIKYHLDRSGLLHVTATDIGLGKQISETLKKVVHRHAQHVNLADLESVKLHEDTEEGDSLFWDAMGTNTQAGSPTEEGIIFDAGIVARAEALCSSCTLEPTDEQELAGELARAKTGDKEAYVRLANLVYYLE